MGRQERRRTERDRARHPRPLAYKTQGVPINELKLAPGGHWVPEERRVSLEEREGVFVHSFVCNRCWLHFALWSWAANRHRAENVACPECGQRDGHFQHHRQVLSESAEFELSSANEIYSFVPWPGSVMLDDSRHPGRKAS